jgi:hypothetical protein
MASQSPFGFTLKTMPEQRSDVPEIVLNWTRSVPLEKSLTSLSNVHRGKHGHRGNTEDTGGTRPQGKHRRYTGEHRLFGTARGTQALVGERKRHE